MSVSNSPKEQRQLDKQLLKAAKKGDTELVGKLLDQGANIEVTSGFWLNTPLISAAWEGKLETAKLLLDRGANINAKNSIEYTPLNAAVNYGQGDIAQLLLDRGADVSIRDSSRRTPRDNAVKSRMQGMVDLLDRHAARKVQEQKEKAERLAAEKAALEKALAEKEAAEKLAAEKKSTEDYANVVIFTQKVGDLTVEDAFNFVSFERMTFVRKQPGGPVESMARQDFSDISNQRLLRKAFEEHVKRGGTVPESEVFPDSKRKLTQPEAKP